MLKGPSAFLEKLAAYVDPALDTTYLTHGIHPYPAKYIPQIPHDIIRQHTNERHCVFDPFCGSGTTLLEAFVLGRRSIGVDSNPIATLISRAKTTLLSADQIETLQKFGLMATKLRRAGPADAHIPSLRNLEHWFTEQAIIELSVLRSVITEITDVDVRCVVDCVFSSIVTSCSRQESETRYVARDRSILAGSVYSRFARKLEKTLPRFADLLRLGLTPKNRAKVITADMRSLNESEIDSDTVDLVVTSPPYPNSFDYYLYHKWRMAWLGYDVRRTQDLEIGSRHEHSSKGASLTVFELKMADTLKVIGRVLKPSKLAYFLVGDAVIRGQLIDMEESLKRSSIGSNLRFVSSVAYPLGSVSRSFHEKRSEDCHGGKKHPEKMQRIVIFESLGGSSVTPGRKTASPTAKLVPEHLGPEISRSGIMAIKSASKPLRIHSLGRYPSKFIPDVPRWAMHRYSAEGDLIVDPFVGSGTTAVEALAAGRRAVVADISPYACVLACAKTTLVPSITLRRYATAFAAALRQPSSLRAGPEIEFDLADFWFERSHLQQFAAVRRYIETEIPFALRPFFLAVAASSIRKFSFQDEGQLKVKRDAKKVISGTPAPVELISAILPRAVEWLEEFNQAARGDEVEVQNVSAVDISVPALADLIVTSPPYINAMNYPMTHRYENILLSLVDPQHKREHEALYFGTERVKAADYNRLWEVAGPGQAVISLNKQLVTIFERERKRSYIAARYFNQMQSAFGSLARTVRIGGHIVIVAGRNTIKQVPVDTFGVLIEMLVENGYLVVEKFEYEIHKQALKLTRHPTADIIPTDGVAVLRRHA